MFDVFAIINWLKKNFSRKEVLLLGIIILLFLLSRLINLTNLPIFTDEGIYINWAKIAKNDASMRFVSLTDGKQPLQTWFTIPLLKLFPYNPLLAGRLFSVGSGLLALIGIFILLFVIFDKKSAYLGALVYTLTPYFLFYDRLALTDSAVNASFIWLLLFSVLLIKNIRLDLALIYGLLAGAALLTKSSAQLFVLLGVFAPLLIFKTNKFFKNIINYYCLFLIVVVMAIAMYFIQILSPYMHYIAIKNTTFLMTREELFQNPFEHFLANWRLVGLYVFQEGGWVIPFLGCLGVFSLLKKNWRLGSYLLLWLLLPYLIISLLSKVIFPRYLIFLGSSLFVFAVFFFQNLKNTALKYFICVLFLIITVYYNWTIIFANQKLPFPEVDRGQYVEGITAGWGIEDILQFARQKSLDKPVILLAEGNFGVVGDMLNASLKKDDQIFVKGYWPLNKEDLLDNQGQLFKYHVYVVFSHRQEFPLDWPIKLIKKYPKPGQSLAFHLFELEQNAKE